MSSQRRVGAIDFWRGLVLVAIFIDHVPGNFIENFTPRNFGFSDSAEAFVFLSGLSVGIVYYPKVLDRGLLTVVRRCLGRAFRIYGVHIALTFCAVTIFAVAYSMSSLEDLIEVHGRSYVFHKPGRGAIGVLLLSQQLGYFNILPMYVVLMVWSPFVLALARMSLPLTIALSVLIYGAARVFGLALPTWPEPGTWFFNPFAWQLVFTLGIAAGILWRRRPVPYMPVALAASVVMLAFAALMVTGGFGLMPGLHDAAFARLDLLKQQLGLVRLLHFLALAYLLAHTPTLSGLTETRLGHELQRLGRHSLPVFAMGSLLSAVGQAVIPLASVNFAVGGEFIGMLYTSFGLAGIFLLARYLEWTKPQQVQQGGAAGKSSSGILLSPPSSLAPPAPVSRP